MTLNDVLEEICAEEYALPANAPHHRFKRAHRRAVNAILYPNGLSKTEKKLPLKRRVLVVIAIVVLAVVTGAASIIRCGGFGFTKNRFNGYDYLLMFAENAENAPKTIEKLCYDCKIPEKYRRIDKMSRDTDRESIQMYVDHSAVVPENHGSPIVMVQQITKSSFVNPIQREETLEPIEVKGFKGVSSSTSMDLDDGTEFILNAVILDCGDYIHMVNGTVSMEEIMSIIDGMTEK